MPKKSEKKNAESQKEFAVIETGGKQYMVSKGDVITVEKMNGDFKKGDKITFDKVLLVDNSSDTTIGTPYISGATVDATFEEAGRNKTVDVIHYKQKSKYF